MGVRSGFHQLTPPIVLDAWRRARRRYAKAPLWEFLGYEWVEDEGGWSSSEVADAYRAKLQPFRQAIRGPAPIGVATEAASGLAATSYHQNVALEHAYAVAMASRGRTSIRILDWGGGIGLLALVIRELYPDLDIEYHVKDVSAVVEVGRELADWATFWDNDDCFASSFDLIVASSSLQYSREWKHTLGQFAASARWTALTRLPVTDGGRSFVVSQRAYGTSYASWAISEAELLEGARAEGLELVRRLVEGWTVEIARAPHPNEHRAYLFRS